MEILYEPLAREAEQALKFELILGSEEPATQETKAFEMEAEVLHYVRYWGCTT